MGRDTEVDVHVVTAQPWLDAVIGILEPRVPYRPWSTPAHARPGDALVVVFDTDPVSVLAGVGIVGPDADIHRAITGADRVHGNTLLELATLNMLADFWVYPREQTVYHRESPQQVIHTLGAHLPAPTEALVGHTSLTAARVLLNSDGKCTACRRRLNLRTGTARDRVHIHTVDPYPPTVDAERDWPAVLCTRCHTTMRREGITSFVDFMFFTHPRCPACGAQHTVAAAYGMPAAPIKEPWIATMGCVVMEPPARWVCGDCHHAWR